MAGLELDGEGDPGVALLEDAPEEDVGVEGAGGDVDGDNGGAHPCPALQQAYTWYCLDSGALTPQIATHALYCIMYRSDPLCTFNFPVDF